MIKPLFRLIFIGLCAFLGGAAVQIAFLSVPTSADTQKPTNYQALFDTLNQKGVETFVYLGQPTQKFYGENGKVRIQIGTYEAAGDRGQPMISLSDKQGHERLLLRLAGPNESPVMLFKDDKGKNRLIIGLDTANPNQDAMISILDKDGKRTSLINKP
jgi:hypothetical protein